MNSSYNAILYPINALTMATIDTPKRGDVTDLLREKGRIARLSSQISDVRQRIKEPQAKIHEWAQETAAEALKKATGSEVTFSRELSPKINSEGKAIFTQEITIDHPLYIDRDKKEGGFWKRFEEGNPGMRLRLLGSMELEISVDIKAALPKTAKRRKRA